MASIESKKTNNGYRLLNILDSIKKSPNTENSDDAIKRVFNLSDKKDIFFCQGEIFTLANTVCSQLNSIPNCDEFYLRWIPKVYEILFTLRINGNTGRFRELYQSDTRIYLEGACVELDKYYPGLQLDSDKLNELYNQIPIIISGISCDTSIDQQMKTFICDRLTQIQNKLLYSNVVGYSDLILNVESIFSATVFKISPDKIKDLKENSKSFAAYIDWIGRFLVLFEAGKIGYTALQIVHKYLLI